MLERFTDKARDVVRLSLVEAERDGVDYVGTEHILAAMMAKGDGKAYAALSAAGLTIERVRSETARLIGSAEPLGDDDAAALKTIGIDLPKVIEQVEQSFGSGAMSTAPASGKRKRWGTNRWTKRSKTVLALALREAKALKHNYIGTEHLLLALIREGQGMAVMIITGAGIPLTQLRQSVLADLD